MISVSHFLTKEWDAFFYCADFKPFMSGFEPRSPLGRVRKAHYLLNQGRAQEAFELVRTVPEAPATGIKLLCLIELGDYVSVLSHEHEPVLSVVGAEDSAYCAYARSIAAHQLGERQEALAQLSVAVFAARQAGMQNRAELFAIERERQLLRYGEAKEVSLHDVKNERFKAFAKGVQSEILMSEGKYKEALELNDGLRDVLSALLLKEPEDPCELAQNIHYLINQEPEKVTRLRFDDPLMDEYAQMVWLLALMKRKRYGVIANENVREPMRVDVRFMYEVVMLTMSRMYKTTPRIEKLKAAYYALGSQDVLRFLRRVSAESLYYALEPVKMEDYIPLVYPGVIKSRGYFTHLGQKVLVSPAVTQALCAYDADLTTVYRMQRSRFVKFLMARDLSYFDLLLAQEVKDLTRL